MNDEVLRETLVDLAQQHKELLVALKGRRMNEKDSWDKFSSISTFLSGIIIALVGLVFTHLYNERQAERDEVLKAQQIRVAQVELMQKFLPQLMGSEQDKKLALVAIAALGNTELATNIAALDRSTGSRQALEAIAVNGKTEPERQLAAKALANYTSYAPMLADVRGGSTSGRRALTVAIEELKAGSYEEVGGSNQGPRIDKYLKAANLPAGMPWSGAFVSWCFQQIPGGPPFRPSGSFQAIMKEFEDRGWLHRAGTDYRPEPGDVLFLVDPEPVEKRPLRASHGGIVLKVEGDTVHVIEGNTNIDGGRQGVMVAARSRKLSSRTAFGHVPDQTN